MPPVVPATWTIGLTKPPFVAVLLVIWPLKLTFGSPPSTTNPPLVMFWTIVFWNSTAPEVLSR